MVTASRHDHKFEDLWVHRANFYGNSGFRLVIGEVDTRTLYVAYPQPRLQPDIFPCSWFHKIHPTISVSSAQYHLVFTIEQLKDPQEEQ